MRNCKHTEVICWEKHDIPHLDTIFFFISLWELVAFISSYETPPCNMPDEMNLHVTYSTIPIIFEFIKEYN